LPLKILARGAFVASTSAGRVDTALRAKL